MDAKSRHACVRANTACVKKKKKKKKVNLVLAAPILPLPQDVFSRPRAHRLDVSVRSCLRRRAAGPRHKKGKSRMGPKPPNMKGTRDGGGVDVRKQPQVTTAAHRSNRWRQCRTNTLRIFKEQKFFSENGEAFVDGPASVSSLLVWLFAARKKKRTRKPEAPKQGDRQAMAPHKKK